MRLLPETEWVFINEEDGDPFLQSLSNGTELVSVCVLGTFCVYQHQSLTLSG